MLAPGLAPGRDVLQPPQRCLTARTPESPVE